jgi:hypothetical protein
MAVDMVKLLFHFLNGKEAPCVCWEAANLGCDHSRSSAFFLNLYLPSSNKFIGLLGLDSFCLHAWSVHLTLDQPRSNRINLSLTMSLLSCVNSLSFKTGLSLSVRGLFNQAPNYQRAIQQGKTHATIGLPCECGEVTIWRDISVIWERGLRGG